MGRLGTGNLFRTTRIMFGEGKSTVIKMCVYFMETLILHKNEFVKFLEDTRDLPWLVGPYPHYRNLTRNQCKFNKILVKTRVIVERAFGKLICQWHCLHKPLEENTPKVPLTIITCCILHNICILRVDELGDSNYSSDDDDNPPADFGEGRIRQLLLFLLLEY
ncbi:hypothetical protein P5673_021736, partial [Acropora cervicornis]